MHAPLTAPTLPETAPSLRQTAPTLPETAQTLPAPPIGAEPGDALDVVVIGAGQAGLAIGRQLQLAGRRFAVLDAGAKTGDAWRSRWDSLVLFTSARHSALPGLPFPGDQRAMPTKDAVADYLAWYAAAFDLPIHHGQRVEALTRDGGLFHARTAHGVVSARAAVIATGPFQAPIRPAAADLLPSGIHQLHSSDYRNPAQLRPGPVLVVGGGNSGMQIAADLAADRVVHLSLRGTPRRVPGRLLGREAFGWLAAAGLITAHADSRRGRWFRARGGDLVIGDGPRQLRRLGVRIHPEIRMPADGAVTFADRRQTCGDAAVTFGNGAHTSSDGAVTFADGTRIEPRTIIWATGYRTDHSWVRIAGATRDGALRHTRGVCAIPGLYTIGAPWQNSRGSALLGFVGRDARLLDSAIAEHLDARRRR